MKTHNKSSSQSIKAPAQKRKITTQAPFPKKSKRQLKQEDALNVFSTIQLDCTEENELDMLKFFAQIRPTILDELKYQLLEKKAIKWYGNFRAILSRTASDGEVEYITPHFRSKVMIELLESTVSEHIEEAFNKIKTTFDEFTQLGSGWVLEKILYFDLRIAKYHPLAASSHFKLPKKLEDKKAVLNINNQDDKCLVWCLIAHERNLSFKDHPERVSKYESDERKIQLGNVECPVPVTKIPIIERLNDLRINVFGYEDDEVFPMYISPREDSDCINLLYISNAERDHYCLIRNMSRLLGNLTKHREATFYCYRCLHRFSQERLLRDHVNYCKEQSVQKIKMPELGDNEIKFENIHYLHPIPYVIYADFESLIVGIDQVHTANNTQKIAHHEACGYAYLIVGPDGKPTKPITVYRGPNAVQHFIDAILEEKEELSLILTNEVPIIMSPQDDYNFQTATHCSLCKKELKNGDKVKDHDHLTGRYRGALHNVCNLKYRLQKKIPIVFHNLKHYDGHLLMQQLGSVSEHDFHVVPTTMEKYISFSLTKKVKKCRVSLNFIDSYQFMATSLEKLVKNLEHDLFLSLRQHFPQNTNLLLRKGVYPYEYMDSFQKFEERELPPIDAFKSSLSGQGITDEDYEHAKNVWQAFELQTMGDYHDLYVKVDVLQLADTFQNFRKICQDFYKIDCVHLLTAPGLAWQSCLKMMEEPLELFTDINMHLFIEKGIRGGISVITKRWAQAKNEEIDNIEGGEENNYIMYWDANNLYGWAMSQYLPCGEFQWMSPDHLTVQEILALRDNSPEGYIFEVDLHYPQHLHESHNDYPLAPEKKKITFEDLSPFSIEALQNEKYCPATKLTPNLSDKKNYVTYYKNLQFYLRQGLQLQAVHKVLKFKQKPWLKKYIEFNTEHRKNAKSPFEKDFFKLMNNSVYGKTLENIRNRIDVQLVNQEQKAKKLVSAPTFKRFEIFDHDLVAIERTKKSLTLNKPVYVGFVILELSKILMYDFHYNFIKRNYAERASLLFTDTDSLTYEIKTKNIYEDMAANSSLFDFSDYPKTNPLYSDENKKVIGKFKDEMNGIPILEFIGLRAKMYSILSSKGEKKAAKGVARNIVDKNIKHAHYKSCLESLIPTREIQHRIQSEKHHLHTIKFNKVALSAFDDKRFLLDDGIHTLAHGHKDILKIKNST